MGTVGRDLPRSSESLTNAFCFSMANKLSTKKLSISPQVAGLYVTAAKRLKAKSATAAPTAAELISLELMHRTPAGIVEDFEQGNWSRRRTRRGSVVVKKRG